jgi:hypothetical protein
MISESLIQRWDDRELKTRLAGHLGSRPYPGDKLALIILGPQDTSNTFLQQVPDISRDARLANGQYTTIPETSPNITTESSPGLVGLNETVVEAALQVSSFMISTPDQSAKAEESRGINDLQPETKTFTPPTPDSKYSRVRIYSIPHRLGPPAAPRKPSFSWKRILFGPPKPAGKKFWQ